MKKELSQEETSNVVGGSQVHVKEGESLDDALKRFKRNCARAGIQQEARKREFYVRPSIKRKKKSDAGMHKR